MAMPKGNGIEIITKKSAYKKRIRMDSYINREYIDLIPFFEECQRVFVHRTKFVLSLLSNVKIFAI